MRSMLVRVANGLLWASDRLQDAALAVMRRSAGPLQASGAITLSAAQAHKEASKRTGRAEPAATRAELPRGLYPFGAHTRCGRA
jgi:hypothetical protein